jgi:hypothetical protein
MMSKGLLVFGAAAGLAAAGVEGLARFQLGLGDPPLTIIDETIEYRFAPGHYRRFGNTVSYNAYSMRSDALPDAATHRVLVAGDSVVNGGAQTDQTETITGQLSARLGPSVFVGNVSAGSWGPANLEAYFQRYGWFDAQRLVFVFSTHDLHDLPRSCQDYGPDFPTSAPPFATFELVTRYLPRLVPALAREPEPGCGPEPEVHPVTPEGPKALLRLLADARRVDPAPLILLHPTRDELESGNGLGSSGIARLLIDNGYDVVDMSGPLAGMADDYRDGIHPLPAINAVYAKVIADRLHPGEAD